MPSVVNDGTTLLHIAPLNTSFTLQQLLIILMSDPTIRDIMKTVFIPILVHGKIIVAIFIC